MWVPAETLASGSCATHVPSLPSVAVIAAPLSSERVAALAVVVVAM